MSKSRRAIFLFAAGCLAAGMLAAKDHPNFSGEWNLDLSQSDFGPIPPPTKFTRKVEHKDPVVNVVTTQAGQQGEMTTTVNYTTDGKECSNTIRGMVAKSTLKWEGDTLVISSRIETPGGAIVQLERWDLAQDGKSILVKTHLDTPNGAADLKLVLVKQ